MNTPKTDSVTKPITDAARDATYGQVVPTYFCREIERENVRLQAERDQWEQTARRLASESGYENSDFLKPDPSG